MQRYYKLRPSRLLTLLLCTLCLGTLVSLWLLPLPKLPLIALTAALLCWTGYCLLLDANLRLRRSCVAFRLEDSEGIVLVLRSGRHLPCQVSTDSLVTPYFVILNVIPSGQRLARSLLILPDAMKAESFRRLRVALRWGDKAGQAAP